MVLVSAETTPKPFSVLDPSWESKVGGLRHVEAVIEPAVVGMRENNYHVTLLLDNFMHLEK